MKKLRRQYVIAVVFTIFQLLNGVKDLGLRYYEIALIHGSSQLTVNFILN